MLLRCHTLRNCEQRAVLEMVLIATSSRENTASNLEGVPTSPDIWFKRDFMKLTVKLTN